MALQNLFGDVALETTQEQLLAHATLLLSAILEKMARVDPADRMAVSIETGTVTTLTTAADLTRLNNFGVAGVTSKPADAIPMHLANAGAMHIYDNIKVS